MLPADYVEEQPAERRQLLKNIHAIILDADKNVSASVEPMMGRDTILYKEDALMKYGLCSVKNYMSLHLMPMYASPKIYATYKALLPKATFQKGCINFSSGEDMPLHIVKQLIGSCAPVNLRKIKDDYYAAKKAAKKK